MSQTPSSQTVANDDALRQQPSQQTSSVVQPHLSSMRATSSAIVHVIHARKSEAQDVSRDVGADSVVASGETLRKLDDVDYLLDGFAATNALNVRRSSIAQLLRVICDDQVLVLLRSRDLISHVLECMAGFDADESLAFLASIALCLLCRDPLNCAYVPLNVVFTLSRCLRKFHPLYAGDTCFSWETNDVVRPLIEDAFALFTTTFREQSLSFDEVHVASLALAAMGMICACNTAVRSDVLNDTSVLADCVDVLKTRIKRFKNSQVRGSGASQASSQSSLMDDWARVTVVAARHADACVPSDSISEDVDEFEEDEDVVVAMWETMKSLELLEHLTATGAFEFHLLCSDLCPVIVEWLTECCSDSLNHALTAACLQGCLKVLLNSTNHNPINATRVGTAIIPQLVGLLQAEDFDTRLLSLGLMVNLSEVSQQHRQRLYRQETNSEERLIDSVLRTFIEYDEKVRTLRQEHLEVQLENEVVRCYCALLLGMIISDSAETAISLLEVFDGSFASLVAALRDFLAIQAHVDGLQQESHATLAKVLESLTSLEGYRSSARKAMQ
jgi:hypothetical protein